MMSDNAYVTREFPVEVLLSMADEWSEHETPDGYEVVDGPRLTTNTRWSLVHEYVFKDPDGNFWRSTFRTGATENQFEDPYEFGGTKCFQVRPREKMVTTWEAVKIG